MDPYIEKHERRNMKKLKEYADRLGYIADAQYGIPTHCLCGGIIIDEVSPDQKYEINFDTFPGRKYFTCNAFKNDDLHFWQPWVFGVQEEVEKLTKCVEKMAEEIAKIKEAMTRPRD